MKLTFRIAETRGDVLRCQNLVASVYNRQYGVVFSEDHFDLDAKIEPWPHRFLMLFVDGEHAATCGLHLRNTYVERFGEVSDSDLREALAAAPEAHPRREALSKREITKVVVAPGFRGRRLGRSLIGAAHCPTFLDADPASPPIVLVCAKLSIFRSQWGGAEIRTRVMKPFPFYKVHEQYRSPEDPMESRLIVPELDVPEPWRTLTLPGSLVVGGER